MSLPCTVLGAGSFGTALAVQLARNGHDVRWWDRDAERLAYVATHRRNPSYLSDVVVPDNLVPEPDLARAVAHGVLLVPVVPSHASEDLAVRMAAHARADAVVCTGTKGLQAGTLRTMAEVYGAALPALATCVLSGPSFARELADGLVTTVAVAGPDGARQRAAAAFHGGPLRVYDTPDLVGVCLGGALKNVMAIATGIGDGLGLGHNARAAIITRGLAEITRLAVQCGADPVTMMGLAGMGDLVLTCTGDLSRNRRVGLGLGAGRPLQEVIDEIGETAEGVNTAKVARALGRREGVDLPITEQVYAVLHQDKPAREALRDLLQRERKPEVR